MSDLQYQPIAAPLFVAVAGETITQDKWGQPQSLPVRNKRSAYLQPQAEWGAVFSTPVMSWTGNLPDRVRGPRPINHIPSVQTLPLYIPDVTAVAPARSWAPRYPDEAPILRFRSAYQRSGQFVADVTLALETFGWKPGVNLPTPTKRIPVQLSHLTEIAPVFPIELAWSPILSQQGIKRLNPPPAAWKEDKTPAAPIAAPDLASATFERPVKPVARIVPPSMFAPLYVYDVTVVAPARSWAPTFIDFHPRSGYRPAQPMTFAWRPATFAPPVAPDLVALLPDLLTRSKGRDYLRGGYFGLDRSLVPPFLAVWAKNANNFYID